MIDFKLTLLLESVMLFPVERDVLIEPSSRENCLKLFIGLLMIN